MRGWLKLVGKEVGEGVQEVAVAVVPTAVKRECGVLVGIIIHKSEESEYKKKYKGLSIFVYLKLLQLSNNCGSLNVRTYPFNIKRLINLISFYDFYYYYCLHLNYAFHSQINHMYLNIFILKSYVKNN